MEKEGKRETGKQKNEGNKEKCSNIWRSELGEFPPYET
jgi:hypothetical protein